MPDIGQAVLAGALFALPAVLFAAYGIESWRTGRIASTRLEKDGGSPFLGLRAMEAGYWVLSPLARTLDRWGIHPNAITLFALVPSAAGALALVRGRLASGAALFAVAALCDALDGLVARHRGALTSPSGHTVETEPPSSLRSGAALDSIIDRVNEAMLFGGLALYARDSLPLMALSVSALSAAFLTSYTTAKADAVNVTLPRGVMRRAERAVYALAGCAATPLVTFARGQDATFVERHAALFVTLAAITLGAGLSAIVRIRALVRALNG